MIKELKITGTNVQEFMASLSRELPNDWQCIENGTDNSQNIQASRYYKFQHTKNEKEYLFSFLYNQSDNSCNLANINYFDSGVGAELPHDAYNKLLDDIYTTIISPKHVSPQIIISIYISED